MPYAQNYYLDTDADYYDNGYSPGTLFVQHISAGAAISCNYGNYYINNHTLTLVTFTAPDGTEYAFRDRNTNGAINSPTQCITNPPSRGTIFDTTDGTSATFISDTTIYDEIYPGTPGYSFSHSGYVLLRDGTRFRIENDKVIWQKDRNGNKITYTYSASYYSGKITKIVDSLHREITFEYGIQDVAPYGLSDRITYKGFNGNNVGDTRIIRVSYKTLEEILRPDHSIQSLRTLFPDLYDYDCPRYGPPETCSSTENNPLKPSAIWMPDGRSYKFEYNSYAELARVEMPTGGAIEYDWNNGFEMGDASLTGLYPPPVGNGDGKIDIYRRVVERRVYSDGVNLENKLVIGGTNFIDNNKGYVIEDQYDPNNNLINRAKHYYYGIGSTTGNSIANVFYESWQNGREYQTDVFGSNGTTLLQTSTTEWQQTQPSWYSGLSNNAPINNPKAVEATMLFADTNQISKKAFSYDQYNNLTDTYDYDFKQGENYPFLRRMHVDYVTVNPVNNVSYTSDSLHILNLPAQTWVSSDLAGNNKVSLTRYEYDNYTNDSRHASLMSRNNVSGHDATNFSSGFTTRGNLTQINSYADASNQTGATMLSLQYDILGNQVKTIDAKTNATTINFNDNFGSPNGESRTNTPPGQLNGLSTFAFATSTTNAVGWTNYEQFDYFTGMIVNTEDINGAISKHIFDDLLERLTQSVSAVGTNRESQLSMIYDDANHKIQVTTDLNSLNDNLLKTVSFYDGMGRTSETRDYEADGDYRAVQTKYDALGRSYKTSNAYRPTEIDANHPILWTVKRFDALGREIEIETPDGAKVLKNYSGSAMTVIDQAGRLRRSLNNGIGQLIRIDEPNSAGQLDSNGNPVQYTSYFYDAMNNLTQVQQNGTGTEQCGAVSSCSQTRQFFYDSLSQLKQTTNPESGTTSYTYDPNGNLQTKRDSRGIKTIYDYDALNRPLKRCYRIIGSGNLGSTTCINNLEAIETNTNDVAYTYDDSNISFSKGKLTKVTNGFSSSEYTEFDILGKIRKSRQSTNGVVYDEMTYAYKLTGALIEQKYPSGRIVKNVLDNDGQLSIVQSKANPNRGYWSYAKHFTYTATGVISSMQLGNGLWNSTILNSRLQSTQIALGKTPNATDLLKLNYSYGTTQNNGNMLSHTITVPNVGSNQGFTATQVFAYDTLNRLKQVIETTPNQQGWQQAYTYDRFGNRNYNENGTTTLTKQCGTSPNLVVCQNDRKKENPEIDPVNNRLKEQQDGDGIKDYEYELTGSLKKDAIGRIFTYDADNKLIKVEGNGQLIGEYWYDGDGKRVKKKGYINGQMSEETIFVYDADNKLVAEYSNQTPQTPQVSYLTADTLGTPRINSDANGKILARHDYRPFGEEIITTHRSQSLNYLPDNIRQKFTGYEKDTETSLDFAQARYYHNEHGRFIVPDPLLSSGRPNSPQSWNRFTYASNNPLVLFDPSGLYECVASQTECDQFDAALENDRANLEKIEKQHGKNSEEYRKAARAVNIYGKRGEKNGVTVDSKPLKKGLGGKTVVDGPVAKTAENPTGQNIVITVNTTSFARDSLDLIVAHEGSHAADASDWIASGAKDHNRPNLYQTEFDAYTVSSLFAEARGDSDLTYTIKTRSTDRFFPSAQIWNAGWTEAEVATLRQANINKLLKYHEAYELTPSSNDKAFKK